MLRYDGTSSVPIFANGAGYAALTMAVGGSFRKTPRDTYSRNTVKLELEMTVGEPEASLSGVAQTTAEMRPQHVGPPELSTTRELPSQGTRSNGPNPNYVNHNSPSHGDQFGRFNIASSMSTPIGRGVDTVALYGGWALMGVTGRVAVGLGSAVGNAGRYGWSTLSPVQRNAAFRAFYGTVRLAAELKGFSTKGFPEGIKLPARERAAVVRQIND